MSDEGKDDLWQQQYMNAPLEKSAPEGLLIGSGIGSQAKKVSYTGFLFTEGPDLVRQARQGVYAMTTMVDYSWSSVPWYARLLGLLRLPYDLVKFVVTGRLILVPWPWRW